MRDGVAPTPALAREVRRAAGAATTTGAAAAGIIQRTERDHGPQIEPVRPIHSRELVDGVRGQRSEPELGDVGCGRVTCGAAVSDSPSRISAALVEYSNAVDVGNPLGQQEPPLIREQEQTIGGINHGENARTRLPRCPIAGTSMMKPAAVT